MKHYNGLKERRQRERYTQTELARKVKVSLSTIKKYEQGLLDIEKASYATIVALEDALHCRAVDLIYSDIAIDEIYDEEAV